MPPGGAIRVDGALGFKGSFPGVSPIVLKGAKGFVRDKYIYRAQQGPGPVSTLSTTL